MAEATIRLHHQLATCAGMIAIAAVIFFVWHPGLPALAGSFGLSAVAQVALGVALGGAYWVVALVDYRRNAGSERVRRTVEGYSCLDLSGWNPLWIALAAGIGEELLFRGALQPNLGIWLTSALFALAHAKAYSIAKLDRTALTHAATLFGVSVLFGFMAQYTGLVTAIVVHVIVDVAGLLLVRQAMQQR